MLSFLTAQLLEKKLALIRYYFMRVHTSRSGIRTQSELRQCSGSPLFNASKCWHLDALGTVKTFQLLKHKCSVHFNLENATLWNTISNA